MTSYFSVRPPQSLFVTPRAVLIAGRPDRSLCAPSAGGAGKLPPAPPPPVLDEDAPPDDELLGELLIPAEPPAPLDVGPDAFDVSSLLQPSESAARASPE